jgi:hypothetical protein
MGMNFPSAPLFGELYPNPAVPEKPQYKWDGTTWTAVGDSAGGSGVFVSDTEPTPVPDGSLWWKSNQGTLNIKYNDGDTTQWTEAVAIPVPDMTWAAPYDAMAYSGMQINGSMEVSQERNHTPTNIHNSVISDGWRLYCMTNAISAQTAPHTTLFPGFTYYLNLQVQTPDTSVTGGEFYGAEHVIEGYRVNRLAWGSAVATPITISFWTAHVRTGIYSFTLRNADGTRCYAQTYTQNAANTNEFKTFVIPGCIDGVWNTSNGNGLSVFFAMAAGPTMTAPSAGVWLSGAVNYVAAPGQINAMAAVSDTMRITGLAVLPGTAAPTAAQSSRIMRPYDQELLTCKRYWRKDRAHAVGNAYAIGAYVGVRIPYAPEMRATPAITLFTNTSSGAGARAVSVAHTLPTGVTIYAQATAAGGLIEFSDDVASDARL